MSAVPTTAWQAGFLQVLPVVQTHAKIQFRHMPAERRADAIQEAIAAACVSYQRLAAQGRLQVAHASTLATYAVRRVRNCRQVGSSQTSCDVMSPLAHRKHGFVGHSLRSRHDSVDLKPLLLEYRGFGPADVVAFRIDFEQWLKGLTRRDRRIISAFIRREGTSAVARRFNISEGRVSQLCRQYEQNWAAFQGQAA
jgi:hypothetical protein